ncbi:MAG TPA: hypothetical protein VHX11_01070 [Acidobacteriaceae bacterium]|nr:hypothetical protein [Acidobacteriaceae bacterium]
MRRFFRQGMYLAVVAASTIALASDNLSMQKMSPELSAMNIWVGHWESKTQVMSTPYSDAATVSSEMTCSWSPNHGFVLCDHLMHAPDGTTANSLSVYTYDEADKVYKFFGVEKDSYPREVPMDVKGNVWSFGTEVQNQDKTIMFLTSDEFLSGTKMHFTTEFSDDNGQHWKDLNKGELTKVS